MEKESDHRHVFVFICLASSVLALLFSGLFKGIAFLPLEQVETYTEDLRARVGRKTEVDPNLLLIGVDRPQYAASDFSEETLQAAPILRELQKSFPWSREVWAALIEKLVDAGAKVVAFDMIFGAPSAGDDRLQKALATYKDKVVIGYTLSQQKTDRGDFLQLITPNPELLRTPDVESIVGDERLGYVHVPLDNDGVVRRINFRQTAAQASFVVDEGAILESITARILRKFGRADAFPQAFEPTRFRFGAPPGRGYPVHAVGDVLSPRIWESNYGGGSFFRGKIVLIGPTANIFHDEHDTPFAERKMSGPELHLNILAAALQREFLRETPKWAALTIIVLTGLLAGALSFHNFQPLERLGTLLMSVVSYWVLAQWFYDRAGWVIPVAAPILSFLVSGLLILFYDFFQERIDRVKLRHTMGLYFSPTVLQAVLADPGSMQPKHADVTLLLTDLRNSTPLAEVLGPQGMFDLLNQVFEVQTNAIMREQGNLEHFLGDQFLSYWGAPQPQPDAADRSFRAAIALITAMEALRLKFPENVAAIFGYGVALHSGRVLVGNKGSALRLDYGLVGDSVNAASRIEALTKYYGVRLLVSREFFKKLSSPGVHRLLDRVIVKGKTDPSELLECENPCTPPTFSALCSAYQKTYVLYASGCFAEAQTGFESLVAAFSDGPSKVLAERCAVLAEKPPSDWKGVWKMDSK
jgi:adenylate cyclase